MGDPATREAILAAAGRLLAEHGAAGVRMADVGAAAGVSRQAVYLHFGNRAGLLLALVRHIDEVEGLPELVAHVLEAPTAVEMLDRLAGMFAHFYPRIHAAVEAIDAARRADPEVDAAWRNRMESRFAGCRRVVERLSEESMLSEHLGAGDAADLLFALTSVEGWRILVVERGWSEEAYVRHLRLVLHRALVRPLM